MIDKQIERYKVPELLIGLVLHNATESELERAIDYSMDVIDSCKCDINLLESQATYGILELRNKYLIQ